MRIFWAFACLYLLTSGGHFYASDDVQKYLALDAWWRTGSPAFDQGWTEGVGGKHFAWFPLGASLFMLPGYFAGHLLATLAPWLPAEYVARFCIALQNSVVSAALVALVASLLERLGQARRSAVFAACALGLGTMVWPYAKTAWSEPGATLFLFGACYALWLSSESQLRPLRLNLMAGTLLALAVSMRLEFAVVVPGVLVWLAVRHRGERLMLARSLVAMAAPLSMALLAALHYNQVRYGQYTSLENYRLVQGAVVFPAGGRPVWALENLWHYTFNPGDGLFWFAPACLLGLLGVPLFWRQHRAFAGLILAALVPLLVFYTAFWGLSDWAWGQRYAYVFQPFLLLPAAVFWETRRRLAWGIAALGLCVQLIAVPQNFNYLYEREQAQYPDLTAPMLMSEPIHNPLRLATVALGPTLTGGGRLLLTPRPTGPLSVASYRERAQFVPDMWPFLQLLTPLPRYSIFLPVLFLALLGVLSLVYRRRPPGAEFRRG